MEKDRLESLIIDYIDDRLNAIDKKLIEEELMRNEDAMKLYRELKTVISAMEESEPLEPSPGMKEAFERELGRSATGGHRGRSIFFEPSFYRVAAAIALMVVSGAVGFLISNQRQDDERLVRIEQQMDEARSQLADTREAMIGLIGDEQSASQRLRGVNVAMELQDPDAEIIDVLFTAMNSDPNTNVRLAALEALAKFQSDDHVRRGLIRSLTSQSDPMVQIRLIQLMVQMKEKGVVDDLRKMVDDAGTMKAVKDEAYSGILKLS